MYNKPLEQTAASGLRTLAVPSSLRFSAAAQRDRSIYFRLLKTPFTLITEIILQAGNRGGARFPLSYRESVVRNRFGLVDEYPSGCLAADKTTSRLSNICQAVSFLPDTLAFYGRLDGGPAGFASGEFQMPADVFKVG